MKKVLIFCFIISTAILSLTTAKSSLSDIIVSLEDSTWGETVNHKAKRQLKDILSNLPRLYCPMRGFNGQSYCPSTRSLGNIEHSLDATNSKEIHKTEVDPSEGSIEVSTIEFNKKSGESYVKINPINSKQEEIFNHERKSTPRIISGFGFDRVTREMKFPVYPSSSPTVNNHVENRVRDFNTVNDFINFVRGQQSNQEAGVYVRNYDVIRQIANGFGDASAKLGITQRLVRTHVTRLQSSKPIDSFTEAVNSLPPYNRADANVKQQYRMLITFWGTDIATDCNHGGIVYQTTAIKKCFGGNIHEGMLNDIDSAINRREPGSGYMRYRKLGIFEARGGNPEIGSDRMVERINTFRQAPAPINWQSVPLWNAVSDAQRRSWVQAAVNDYINESQHTPNDIINKVRAAEVANYNRRRNLYIADITHGHRGGLSYRWEGCGFVRASRSLLYTPHCALLRPVEHLAATQHKVLGGILGSQRVIERNGNGLVRIRITKDGRTLGESPWVRTGCAILKHPGTLRYGRNTYPLGMFLSRAVCIDCLPHIEHRPGEFGTTHTLLTCVCDHF